jgi:thiol-disulfide isomerase/thioredoxin
LRFHIAHNLVPTLSLCAALLSATIVVDADEPTEEHVPYKGDVQLLSPAELQTKLDTAQGTVVMVNFWATWCRPCVDEQPEFAAFYTERQDKDLLFLSISVDHPTTLDDALKPFLEKLEPPFPVYVLEVDTPDELTETIELSWGGGLPATFVFGPNGALVHSWMEEVDREHLAKVIDPLLTNSEKSEKHSAIK